MEHASREAWLEARRNGIGGSDAAAVLGCHPWKSALELYAEKIGVEDLDLSEPEWVYWGKVLEPQIAARYMKETGRTVIDPVPYLLEWSEKRPFMCCTVDRHIVCPEK